MRMQILFIAGLLALGACDRGPTETQVMSASSALATARVNFMDGKPIDRPKLEAMPGLQVALEKDSRDMRERLAAQMKDPTSVIWGELWTVDYVHVCGEVNAKNSFGAYTGRQMFFSEDGVSARMPGNPLWKIEDLAHCVGGTRRLILPADPTN